MWKLALWVYKYYLNMFSVASCCFLIVLGHKMGCDD